MRIHHPETDFHQHFACSVRKYTHGRLSYLSGVLLCVPIGVNATVVQNNNLVRFFDTGSTLSNDDLSRMVLLDVWQRARNTELLLQSTETKLPPCSR